MQLIAFDIADGFAVDIDLVQMAAAVVEVVDGTAVGQHGLGAVAQSVVAVAHGGALAVVGGGFADQLVEHIVSEFDAAVGVTRFNQVAGEHIVFKTGAADAFVFAVGLFAVDAAAGFFDQLAEDIALEMVEMPDFRLGGMPV